jgi:hypothetical protein
MLSITGRAVKRNGEPPLLDVLPGPVIIRVPEATLER